jgi:cell wall-associated NlpC family hydrolase
MTQIVIDLGELERLGTAWADAEMQLAGLVADVQRRVLSAGFDLLPPYGVDPGPVLSDIESACSRLMADSLSLETETAEVRQALWEAAQAQHASLGPYAAAMPDLWWFKAHAIVAPAVPAVVAPAPGAALPESALPESTLQLGIVNTAAQWEGVPYVWGGGHDAVGAIRGTGVDCSGLVHQVFGENGISISGTAQNMYDHATPVASLAQAKPGDLLFWGTPDDIHHVAIYIGGDEMIEAPHTGAFVHAVPVYLDGFAGIGRVLP